MNINIYDGSNRENVKGLIDHGDKVMFKGKAHDIIGIQAIDKDKGIYRIFFEGNGKKYTFVLKDGNKLNGAGTDSRGNKVFGRAVNAAVQEASIENLNETKKAVSQYNELLKELSAFPEVREIFANAEKYLAKHNGNFESVLKDQSFLRGLSDGARKLVDSYFARGGAASGFFAKGELLAREKDAGLLIFANLASSVVQIKNGADPDKVMVQTAKQLTSRNILGLFMGAVKQDQVLQIVDLAEKMASCRIKSGSYPAVKEIREESKEFINNSLTVMMSFCLERYPELTEAQTNKFIADHVNAQKPPLGKKSREALTELMRRATYLFLVKADGGPQKLLNEYATKYRQALKDNDMLQASFILTEVKEKIVKTQCQDIAGDTVHIITGDKIKNINAGYYEVYDALYDTEGDWGKFAAASRAQHGEMMLNMAVSMGVAAAVISGGWVALALGAGSMTVLQQGVSLNYGTDIFSRSDLSTEQKAKQLVLNTAINALMIYAGRSGKRYADKSFSVKGINLSSVADVAAFDALFGLSVTAVQKVMMVISHWLGSDNMSDEEFFAQLNAAVGEEIGLNVAMAVLGNMLALKNNPQLRNSLLEKKAAVARRLNVLRQETKITYEHKTGHVYAGKNIPDNVIATVAKSEFVPPRADVECMGYLDNNGVMRWAPDDAYLKQNSITAVLKRDHPFYKEYQKAKVTAHNHPNGSKPTVQDRWSGSGYEVVVADGKLYVADKRGGKLAKKTVGGHKKYDNGMVPPKAGIKDIKIHDDMITTRRDIKTNEKIYIFSLEVDGIKMTKEFAGFNELNAYVKGIKRKHPKVAEKIDSVIERWQSKEVIEKYGIKDPEIETKNNRDGSTTKRITGKNSAGNDIEIIENSLKPTDTDPGYRQTTTVISDKPTIKIDTMLLPSTSLETRGQNAIIIRRGITLDKSLTRDQMENIICEDLLNDLRSKGGYWLNRRNFQEPNPHTGQTGFPVQFTLPDENGNLIVRIAYINDPN